MKTLLINIALGLLVVLFMLAAISQCSQKKATQKELISAVIDRQQAEADYLKLVKAKSRIDTVYKDSKPVTHYDTSFQTITDTFLVDSGKVFGKYAWSIDTADLKLNAKIVASNLRSIDYTYKVREKIIREQSILTEHDTLIQVIRKGQLLAVGDIGLDNYSIGLQWQSKGRFGFGGRFTIYNDEKYYSAVISYRIR